MKLKYTPKVSVKQDPLYPTLYISSMYSVVGKNIQGDRKVSVRLTITVHTTDELKMAIKEYIRNVDRAVLSTVFDNTVRRVNISGDRRGTL